MPDPSDAPAQCVFRLLMEAGLPWMLTEDEMRDLLQALNRSGRPWTEADADIVYDWALGHRLGAGILTLLSQGRLALHVEHGQVYLDEVRAP